MITLPETVRRGIEAKLRRHRDEEPHSIGVPPGLRKFESGNPQPDWVRLIHRSRESH